ncbi:MAG: translation initiation factor IF-2 [Candidatus Melainabacteria bacterium]|nr:translation initiation factor IF-2 [Candidatus Melainabacteria bacterium]
MASTKPRIYDLARIATRTEDDEKERKQKQSDLTKQIIAICNQLGYPDKTSSSSIDEDLMPKLISSLNEAEGLDLDLDGVNKELQVKKTTKKSVKTQEEAQEKQEIKPKQKLRVVRRIKPSELTQDLALLPPIQEKPGVHTSQQVKPSPPPQIQQKPIQPVVQKPVEEPPKEKQEIPQVAKKKQQGGKPRISVPLQPFRVAKPTMVPSMMGRTKRPSSRRGSQEREKEKKKIEITTVIDKPGIVTITSSLTVKELADILLLPETEVVKKLFEKGTIRTVNQTVDFDIAVELARSLEYEVITEEEKEETKLRADISKEAEEDLLPRPPVVTIMGHVDHGKTSLLDAIRETKLKITDQEKGGITQHIGAYQVEVLDYDNKKRKITFLDTPGHEAFTAMRARGAHVTDIAILVVAADDGVMPQTKEAIDHAKSAAVPIIIALNKIDKPEAQPDRVLGQLAEHDLLIEDYGGKTVCSKISAKKRENLDDLLTKITLVADAELGNTLRANPNALASGVVLEAELSKERGPLTHILVHNGTLKKGDCIVAGAVAGRIRAMFNDHGEEIGEAPPSAPVEVLGLSSTPKAGDTFQVYSSYQEVKNIAEERQQKVKEGKKTFGLVDVSSKIREGKMHELKIIIKADVYGSAEAVAKEILKLRTDEVVVNPIHVGSGNISESDVDLAASSGAIIIGFHVGAESNALREAGELGVDIRTYDIIYKITEDLEKALLGMLEPEREEVKLGKAEVRQVFTFGKGNKIAGSYVIEGKIQRNQIAKVIRNGNVIFEGRIDNLKRFKDDAREVQTNFECGISFNSYNDVEEGDIIECWTIIEKQRTSLT